MRRLTLGILGTAASLVLVTACGGSSGSSGSSGTIKIGLITSLSGPLAAQFVGVDKDFKARIEVENAKGGVNGRRIEVVVADDAGSSQGNLTAAQKLVQSDHVVAVANESAFVSGSIRYLNQAKIPVFGGLYSGPFWGKEPYRNMFGSWGSADPDSVPFTTIGAYLKSIGSRSVGSIGYSDSPSSKVDAENQGASTTAAGLATPIINTSTQIGSNDFSGLALSLKDAGVDTVITALGGPANVALITAAKQAGAPITRGFLISTYSPSILGSAAESVLQGMDFGLYYAPQQLGSPATKAVQAALEKYAGLGKDTFYAFDIMGWLSASAIIAGLTAAGDDPTPASIISSMRTVSDFDADGLLPAKVNFADFGKGSSEGLGANGCTFVVRLTGDTFVPQNGGKPICGEPISE
ncbi:ABC transporter substrate-binding protein [Parafrankia elaeagni]|uniref:ABC transporter substrate-binding protein n=1 Tax=Parafrankia elaeagni TaxID=222534 RepID=UPI00037B3AAD|nr:ABC transporter substrate-binding protein [Parafrankia elaeagni]